MSEIYASIYVLYHYLGKRMAIPSRATAGNRKRKKESHGGIPATSQLRLQTGL